MATYTLVKLKNLSPLHIGTGKENYDFSASELQSDTLSAALAAIKAQRDPSVDLFAFLDSFVISSAFPYMGDHYFLPRPLGKISVRITDCDEYVQRKKLKKIKFVEVPLWRSLVAGESLSVIGKQLKGTFLVSETSIDNFSSPYKSQVSQRVTVPRDEAEDAEPFFFEWKYFHAEGGLFCLLNTPNSLKDELIGLFQILGEWGLGTDRNIGGGKFEVEVESLALSEIERPNAQMLLSLFIPRKEELDFLNLENACYELLQRGGYISGSSEVNFQHLRKKSVYMFNAASVFQTTHALQGKLVDLRPEWNDEQMHPVFRSGKPFVVPIKTACI